MEEKNKLIIAITGLFCLTMLQIFAWYTNHNGVVWATTSAIFGIVIGHYFKVDKLIKK